MRLTFKCERSVNPSGQTNHEVHVTVTAVGKKMEQNKPKKSQQTN